MTATASSLNSGSDRPAERRGGGRSEGLGEVHALDVDPQGDALIQRSHRRLMQPAAQGRLADQHDSGRRAANRDAAFVNSAEFGRIDVMPTA